VLAPPVLAPPVPVPPLPATMMLPPWPPVPVTVPPVLTPPLPPGAPPLAVSPPVATVPPVPEVFPPLLVAPLPPFWPLPPVPAVVPPPEASTPARSSVSPLTQAAAESSAAYEAMPIALATERREGRVEREVFCIVCFGGATGFDKDNLWLPSRSPQLTDSAKLRSTIWFRYIFPRQRIRATGKHQQCADLLSAFEQMGGPSSYDVPRHGEPV
jgi:hypothetical protein